MSSNDELGQRLLAAGFPPLRRNATIAALDTPDDYYREADTGVKWHYPDGKFSAATPIPSDPATRGYLLWWIGQQYGETMEITRRSGSFYVWGAATGQPVLGVGETEADALVSAAEELVRLKVQKERIRALREEIHYGTHVRVRAHGPDPIDVTGLVIYAAADRMAVSNVDGVHSIHFNDVTDFAIYGQLEPVL